MQVEQILHFFLENARKSLIYQSLLMSTTSTRWVWMWLTSMQSILIHSSYPDAIGIHISTRCCRQPLINSVIIYLDFPATLKSTVGHFDFHLSIVHDLLQAGSASTMNSSSHILTSKSITWSPPASQSVLSPTVYQAGFQVYPPFPLPKGARNAFPTLDGE